MEQAAQTATPTATAATPDSPKAEQPSGDWVQAFVAGKGAEESAAPAPAAAVDNPVEKPADKPVETKAEEKPEDKADDKPDAKSERKAKPDKTAKEKPEPEGLEKQLKDTRDYATRVNQVNLAMDRKLNEALAKIEVLTKKLDGTYEEPAPTPPAEVERQASLIARTRASHAAALKQYGAAELERLITGPDAPWKELEKDPVYNARVFASELPVVEAMEVVKEHQAKQKYGTADVETIRTSIRDELTKELRDSIRADLLKEIRGKGDEEVRGLSGVPTGGRTDPVKGAPDKQQQFASLFPNA